jgi:hypothetical protein
MWIPPNEGNTCVEWIWDFMACVPFFVWNGFGISWRVFHVCVCVCVAADDFEDGEADSMKRNGADRH